MKKLFLENIKKQMPLIYNALKISYIPLRKLKKQVRLLLEKEKIREAPSFHRKALAELKGKKKLRCVFFALFEEVWKYDDVYKLMVQSERFEPIILVCPIVNFGQENMKRRMMQCYNAFLSKGYNVVKSFDSERNSYVDVDKDLDPDIILYTNPYKGLIDDRYYITNYRKKLTVYVPYYYNSTALYNMGYNELTHNLVWRYYVENSEFALYSKKYSSCGGRNVVITGYPGIEKFIKPYIPMYKDWKSSDNKFKRIIWAPHHTIDHNLIVGKSLMFSCFLMYCDFMLQMAEKYENEIQLVFKPHPLLKNKLYKLWGEKKTDEYYNQWKSRPNCSYNDGDYTDLFYSSDAMIHDSGSFTVEYLYMNKPVMRTMSEFKIEELYNPFAIKCVDVHEKAYKETDIEKFINDVINNVDTLKDERTKFVNNYLMPKESPSQNIITDIIESVDNQILYRN